MHRVWKIETKDYEKKTLKKYTQNMFFFSFVTKTHK